MSETDPDCKLGELHREAHAADDPPAFQRVWSAARLQAGTPPRDLGAGKEITFPRSGASGGSRRRRLRPWVWAPAALLLAVLSLAGGLRARAVHRQRELAQQISLWAAADPLGFLLETPGRELLRSVPSFDSKGEW